MYISNSTLTRYVGVPQRRQRSLLSTDIGNPPNVTVVATRSWDNKAFITLTCDHLTAGCWGAGMTVNIGGRLFTVFNFDVSKAQLTVIPASRYMATVYLGEDYAGLVGLPVTVAAVPLSDLDAAFSRYIDAENKEYFSYMLANGVTDYFIWDNSLDYSQTTGLLIQICNIGTGAIATANLDFSLDGLHWNKVPDVTNLTTIATGTSNFFYTIFNPGRCYFRLSLTGATEYVVYTAG